MANLNYWDELLNLETPGYYLTDESAARIHAEIDFQRACQAYLWALPAMNLYSMREGSEREFGRGNHILPIWKGRLKATTKVTTPNSDVISRLHSHLSKTTHYRSPTSPLPVI